MQYKDVLQIVMIQENHAASPSEVSAIRARDVQKGTSAKLERVPKPAFEPRISILSRNASRRPKNIRDILRSRRSVAGQNRNSQSRNGVWEHALVRGLRCCNADFSLYPHTFNTLRSCAGCMCILRTAGFSALRSRKGVGVCSKLTNKI